MIMSMAFGVFLHKSDSPYKDELLEQYQFPKIYLKQARQIRGNWVIYKRAGKNAPDKDYFAVAKVLDIKQDTQDSQMYVAIIEPGSYLDFGKPVPFRDSAGYVEQGLLNSQGMLSGRKQSAMRTLSASDFVRIMQRGLDLESDIAHIGEQESEQIRVDELINRKVRDKNFRKAVLTAYNKSCAITGLNFINGGGSPEVEAAHIKPVKYNGPDIVNNGIALSRTIHWMFDRGLIGIEEDLTIRVSRHINDRDAVNSMINDSRKLIKAKIKTATPRSDFLAWHRENCFKH